MRRKRSYEWGEDAERFGCRADEVRIGVKRGCWLAWHGIGK